MTFKFKIGDKVKAYRKESIDFYGFDFIGTVTGCENSHDPEYTLEPSCPHVYLFWEEELTPIPD